MPIVAVGDFNGMPETPAIALMRERFTSAYAAIHGQEPEYTCPTPLKKHRSWQYKLVKYLVSSLLTAYSIDICNQILPTGILHL